MGTSDTRESTTVTLAPHTSQVTDTVAKEVSTIPTLVTTLDSPTEPPPAHPTIMDSMTPFSTQRMTSPSSSMDTPTPTVPDINSNGEQPQPPGHRPTLTKWIKCD